MICDLKSFPIMKWLTTNSSDCILKSH
jgi:hypothetical protein